MLILIFTILWGVFLYEVCVYRRFKAIIFALSQGYGTAILTYLILFCDLKKGCQKFSSIISFYQLVDMICIALQLDATCMNYFKTLLPN